MRRALLIGFENYADRRIPPLAGPSSDVSELAKVLAEPAIGNFDVTSALDFKSQQCRELIDAFYTEAAQEDLLLLYVSGHGLKDRQGRLHFATVDTRIDRLASTAVASTLLQDIAAHSRSQRQVMIFDTCFSGAFSKGMIVKSGQAIGSGEYFSQGDGRIVITACDHMQFAFVGESASGAPVESAFTKHLVHGLRTGEADHDADGYVSVDDLYHYVRKAMRDSGEGQEPQRWTFGLRGDLEIATNPNPPVAPIPPEVLQLLVHPMPDVNRSGVERLRELFKVASAPLKMSIAKQLESIITTHDSRSVSSHAQSVLESLIPPRVPTPAVTIQTFVGSEVRSTSAPNAAASAENATDDLRCAPTLIAPELPDSPRAASPWPTQPESTLVDRSLEVWKVLGVISAFIFLAFILSG